MNIRISAITTTLALAIVAFGKLHDTQDHATAAAVLAINLPMIAACKKTQFEGAEALYNHDDAAFNKSQELATYCNRVAQVVTKANDILIP